MNDYIQVFDNAKFRLLLKKSEIEISKIIKKYDKKKEIRITLSFNGIERFLEVQELLNKFAISKNLHIQNNVYRLYKLIPVIDERYNKDKYLTFHLGRGASFEWDQGDRRTILDCENFLIENFIMNPNFATHKDQEGYLWKPDVFTNNWYCFLKNGWREVELEKHLDLNLL